MQKKYQVFVAEALPPKEIILTELGKFAEVRVGSDHPYSESELISEVKNIDALLVTSRAPITRQVIESAEKLQVICKYGVGLENIDIKAATENGILVTYSPTIATDAVAELTIMLMLATLRKLPLISKHKDAYREGTEGWRAGVDLMGSTLIDKTVGIVGLGRIGSRVAKKLAGFNVNFLAYDPYVLDDTQSGMKVRLVKLETLLRNSDVVTIHTVLNPETKHLIGEKELKLMKSSAILVNTSRGAVIDENALYNALSEGSLAGAGLDVLEKEPPNPDNPLFELDNVVITSHCGATTKEVRELILRKAAENIFTVLDGRLPPTENIANPEVIKKTP